jgi:hypothetical protein
MQEMHDYVISQQGGSRIFLANAFDEETEKEILERFLQDRQKEYAEFVEQCADFLAELDKETQREKFSFAEYEENEQDLNKLESWFSKIQQRDFLKGDHAREAAELLDSCRATFQAFTAQVFARENLGDKEPDEDDSGTK